MRDIRNISRSLAIIVATILSATGISWAALQSAPAKLTGNTIETASANLVISTDGSNFSSSLPGFDFNNLVPGGQSPNTFVFTLKNSGGTSLNLKVAVSSTPSNPNGVDLSKVFINLTPSGGSTQSFSLAALMSANSTGGLAITNPMQLFVGNRVTFSIDATMAADALSGPSASIGNIDLAFTGVAVTS